MRERNNIGMEEAKALAKEEKERMDRLDEKGLCHSCEENPQNPYLSASVCMDCLNTTPRKGCQVTGCPNTPDGNYRQGQYCAAHLADIIHDSYQKYIEWKDSINNKEQEFEDRASTFDADPRNDDMSHRELTEEQKDFIDDWISFRKEKQELGMLKREIEKAMEDLDEPFPEGYKVFG